jgi:chromosome segregation ATPase
MNDSQDTGDLNPLVAVELRGAQAMEKLYGKAEVLEKGQIRIEDKVDELLKRKVGKKAAKPKTPPAYILYGQHEIKEPYTGLVPFFEEFRHRSGRTVDDIASEMNSIVPNPNIASDYLGELGSKDSLGQGAAGKIVAYLNIQHRPKEAGELPQQAACKYDIEKIQGQFAALLEKLKKHPTQEYVDGKFQKLNEILGNLPENADVLDKLTPLINQLPKSAADAVKAQVSAYFEPKIAELAEELTEVADVVQENGARLEEIGRTLGTVSDSQEKTEGKLADISRDVSGMNSGMGTLAGNQGEIAAGMGSVRGSMRVLAEEQGRIAGDVNAMKGSVDSVAASQGEMRADMNAVEGAIGRFGEEYGKLAADVAAIKPAVAEIPGLKTAVEGAMSEVSALRNGAAQQGEDINKIKRAQSEQGQALESHGKALGRIEDMLTGQHQARYEGATQPTIIVQPAQPATAQPVIAGQSADLSGMEARLGNIEAEQKNHGEAFGRVETSIASLSKGAQAADLSGVEERLGNIEGEQKRSGETLDAIAKGANDNFKALHKGVADIQRACDTAYEKMERLDAGQEALHEGQVALGERVQRVRDVQDEMRKEIARAFEDNYRDHQAQENAILTLQHLVKEGERKRQEGELALHERLGESADEYRKALDALAQLAEGRAADAQAMALVVNYLPRLGADVREIARKLTGQHVAEADLKISRYEAVDLNASDYVQGTFGVSMDAAEFQNMVNHAHEAKSIFTDQHVCHYWQQEGQEGYTVHANLKQKAQAALQQQEVQDYLNGLSVKSAVSAPVATIAPAEWSLVCENQREKIYKHNNGTEIAVRKDEQEPDKQSYKIFLLITPDANPDALKQKDYVHVADVAVSKDGFASQFTTFW